MELKEMFGYFILLALVSAASSEGKMKIVCFGDVLQLKCEPGEKLEIFGSFVNLLQGNSTQCVKANSNLSPCLQPTLKRLIRKDCHGKSECLLGYQDSDASIGTIDCRPLTYLTVLYSCIPNTILRTTSSPANTNTNTPKDILLQPALTDSSVTTTKTEVVHITGKSNMLFFTRLLVQLKIIFIYGALNDRKLILVVLISIGAGILMFILFCTLIVCCERCAVRKRDKFDVEDGKTLEITSPVIPTSVASKYETVLVTRQNGVSLTETTISSDSTLNRRGKGKPMEHQLISTIRRTHSIDEGTQTDIEDDGSDDLQPQQLSLEEQQELGYLVDVMKYYNRKLDDDFYTDFKGTNKTENRFSSPDSKTFHYSKSDKKPLLAYQAGSSIEADSRNGDSSSDERMKFRSHKDSSRIPSELSYTTSTSNTSLDFYSRPDSVFAGDSSPYKSLQRSTPLTPRSPKPGVRGDGFDFIKGE